MAAGGFSRGADCQHLIGHMASSTLQVRIDPGNDTRYFESGPIPFQPDVLEVIGADTHGRLLPNFTRAAICKLISEKLSISVDPEMVFGMDNIPCCGLYPLWIIERDRIQRFRFWVLMNHGPSQTQENSAE